jgi:NADH-ubiquinone oxidoreductase chain 6
MNIKIIIYMQEIVTNGYMFYTLSILSIIAIIFGISVIVNKNPIISILFLIGLFGSISSYLIILGLTFIGLSYLIVYIGAVSILFLFILMLINIRVSELQSNTSNSISLTILSSISISYCLFEIFPYNTFFFNFFNLINEKYLIKKDLLLVTSESWDGNIGESNHITTIGNILYANYNIWLIIVSFILLLAMVGAIVITIRNDTDDLAFKN